MAAVNRNGTGQNRLIAYYVLNGGNAPNGSDLRRFLSEKLPAHMVPALFLRLDALPLNANGKVDRHALPKPDQARPELEKKYASPRDAVELELAGIWERTLGVHPIGIEDKFFDLGGHSLLAVRVVGQIERAFGKKVSVATLFQAPTIAQLALFLREETRPPSAAAATSVVEIQSKGAGPPLFLVHGAGGGMFWGYVNLARRLGLDQPVYGFRSRGLDGKPEFERVEEMAAQYIADMRLVQPKGPYHLGGYCFGGNVAFEMARQLSAQGEALGLLALINCAPPNSRYGQPTSTPIWFARLFRNLRYWIDCSRHWTSSQRRDFLRWKMQLFRKNLTSFARFSRSELSRLDVENMVDLSPFSPEQQRLWEVHIRAQLNYQPKPFAGRVPRSARERKVTALWSNTRNKAAQPDRIVAPLRYEVL